ncbi:winged helix-turn-helix transcriptional regulator [Kribbella kalugense]|uniref:HxlR family transcriptional regulator n=1 Tax=Kribbella kalugense TaxID=2512221 RepID=A0A4R8A119_9ACTN|nr:helix-turn-helix domain-containing protein [Kribbella kalugense]TDW24189.1 HxlR family transcriptional regulator [Kribbella kalugense]
MSVSKGPAPLGAAEVFQRICPGRLVLDHIAGRWGVRVMGLLRDGPLRFYELRESIDGVSEKMLTQTLRNLARDGLVERTATETVPPRVSYALTELGQGVVRPLGDLLLWLSSHGPQIAAAQRAHDRASLGLPAHPADEPSARSA